MSWVGKSPGPCNQYFEGDVLKLSRMVVEEMSRIPVVDIGLCSLCGGCIEVCPMVFRLNEAGYVEVAELKCYPDSEVEEAIKYCPEDCISWEDE